jgi:uncharacterized membrane protein YdjX (TVP38/TMEM64 family)
VNQPPREPSEWKPLVKACILAAAVVAFMVLLKLAHLDRYFTDPEWRRRLQQAMGAWLPLLYVLAGAVLTALGFPRLAYVVLGGALFGATLGIAWGMCAQVAGSLLGYWFGYSLGRDLVQRRFGQRFARFERHLREKGFALLLLVRLCPVGNNALTNYLAGASAMGRWAFLNATAIGHLPLTIFFAMLGSGLVKGKNHQTAIGLVGFAVASLAFALYFRRSKMGRDVSDELRGGSGDGS